jgi:hypothetical protein
MNVAVLPPTFLATALVTLLAVTALGLTRHTRTRLESWLMPILLILAGICLGAFLLYTFSAG